MNGLDLAALEIFRQAALEGGVSKAAARLGRVPSNVSTRIKQLEERIGAPLFVRSREGLALTEEGRLLRDYAEKLLSLSEEAMEALRRREPRGAFRLGVMESTAAARLPAILSRYHAAHPEVEFQLLTDTAGGLVDRLKRRDVEAAFIAEPLELDWAETEPVFEEKLTLIAPASYPRKGGRPDLTGKTIIAFEEGCAYRRYLQQWLSEESISPGRVLSVGSYLAILACVAAGAGYAVAPQCVLDVVKAEGDFRTYKLPRRYSRIKTLLAWRRDETSMKLDALREFLKR